MLIAVLDTETEGLGFNHRILQLSYVLVDNKKENRIVKAYNAWIKYPRYHITPKAYSINGLTPEFLDAHGKPASQVADETYADLRNAVIVGHNVAFDIRFITSFYGENDYPTFDITSKRDTMISRLSLVDSVEKYKVSKVLINALTAKHFPESKIHAHDATYDIISTYLLARKLPGRFDD